MKVVFALTVAILGAEVYAFPQFIPPKGNYALRPGTTSNNQGSNTNNKYAPNKNAAGTGIKYSGSQGSSGSDHHVVQGFVPVRGGSANKRSTDDDGDDDYDVPNGTQDDDSGDNGVMFTTFTAPHAKIGTIKKGESSGDDDSAAPEEQKFKAPSTKKQKGKKQKHTGSDDKASKTAKDDHPKATPTPSKKKAEDKAAKEAKKEAKDAAKASKKKHSGDDDSASKTSSDDAPKATPIAAKKKLSNASSAKKDDKKTVKKASKKKQHDDAPSKTATDDHPKSTPKSKSKNQAKTAAHKAHVSKSS